MALDLPRLTAAAEAAIDRARGEILSRFRHVATEIKADGSPVTEADRAAERILRSALAEALPDAAILGEEYGGPAESAELLWVIDPIDGTLAFARGLPLFATLVALVEAGRPVLGVIDLPALGERYSGWRGGGCWRAGERLTASSECDLRAALVSHGDPYCFERAGERAAFARMADQIPMLRGYTDAFGHAQVLAGSVDAMVDLDLALWDAAAAQVLVPEAGGRCVTLHYPARDSGSGSDSETGRVGLVMGAPALVERLAGWLEHGAR